MRAEKYVGASLRSNSASRVANRAGNGIVDGADARSGSSLCLAGHLCGVPQSYVHPIRLKPTQPPDSDRASPEFRDSHRWIHADAHQTSHSCSSSPTAPSSPSTPASNRPTRPTSSLWTCWTTPRRDTLPSRTNCRVMATSRLIAPKMGYVSRLRRGCRSH
jgi:hypothetical protein